MRGYVNPISVAIGVVLGNLGTLAVLFFWRREIVSFIERMIRDGY